MRFLICLAAFALAQSVPAVVSYVDVTARSGIQFRHENSPTPDKYLVETMGSGGAFIDYFVGKIGARARPLQFTYD